MQTNLLKRISGSDKCDVQIFDYEFDVSFDYVIEYDNGGRDYPSGWMVTINVQKVVLGASELETGDFSPHWQDKIVAECEKYLKDKEAERYEQNKH